SAVDFVQADRFRRKVAQEMARIFSRVDLLLVPSLRDEILTITNFTGHPSLTLRAGFVEVSKARSDWAPDPKYPLPTFSSPRCVPRRKSASLSGTIPEQAGEIFSRVQPRLALYSHIGRRDVDSAKLIKLTRTRVRWRSART